MLDTTATATQMQRARGAARVSLLAAAGGASGAGRSSTQGARLHGLHQSGSAKVMLPRVHSAIPEVVFLNTAGGVTGGDRFTYELTLGAGARAVATTQTAERAYRSLNDAGHIATSLKLGERTELHWLPQELILFQGSRTQRTLQVDLAPSARFVFVESVILGRAAMGEVLNDFHLQDLRRIFRDGRPVLWDMLDLTPSVLGSPAGVQNATALATLGIVAPNAEDRLDLMRAAMVGDGVVAAVSAWDGKLIIRATAQKARNLREAIKRWVPLMTDAPLPRVWQM